MAAVPIIVPKKIVLEISLFEGADICHIVAEKEKLWIFSTVGGKKNIVRREKLPGMSRKSSLKKAFFRSKAAAIVKT